MNQIIIIGAGVIGLSQALYLLDKGLRITLVDKYLSPDKIFKFTPKEYDTRVFALTPQTINFLQEIGVWEGVQNKRTCPYVHMTVWDGRGSGQIEFDATSLKVPKLGHIVEQSIILEALLERAKQHIEWGNLTWLVQEPVELLQTSEAFSSLKLADGSIIKAQLIIGADGADSWLRREAGISVQAQSYYQTALVATIQSEKPHQYTAYQRFSEGGPLALLPLSDEHKLSIVWTQPTSVSKELQALSDLEFNQTLTAFSENKLGKLALVGERKSFSLKNFQAQSYGANRVVLIGDSAHVIHPLAGLGANLGFQDAMSLGALLIRQHEQKRDLGSNRLIQRYYRERIAQNEAMRYSMTLFNNLFISKNPMVKFLRNWGMDKVNNFNTIKKWFASQAMGLS